MKKVLCWALLPVLLPTVFLAAFVISIIEVISMKEIGRRQ